MVYIETLTAPFVCLGEIGVAVIVKTQVQLRFDQVFVFCNEVVDKRSMCQTIFHN